MRNNPDIHADLVAAEGESILVVNEIEDDANTLRQALHDAGYAVDTCTTCSEGNEILQNKNFDAIVCDQTLLLSDTTSFFEDIRRHSPSSSIILTSRSGSASDEVSAIRDGADDYLTIPFETIQLLVTLRKAKERNRLRNENERLRSQVAKRYSFGSIVAKSPTMMEIFETIKKVAEYRTTVMLYG
ncbi:MAG: response regulator, partial [Bdellovibrionales bacterium]|nr:response regulator [Bdellovibrionales bacterium]